MSTLLVRTVIRNDREEIFLLAPCPKSHEQGQHHFQRVAGHKKSSTADNRSSSCLNRGSTDRTLESKDAAIAWRSFRPLRPAKRSHSEEEIRAEKIEIGRASCRERV